MNKAKRLKHIKQNPVKQTESICRNCGKVGLLYIPPSFGEDGVYICREKV